MKEETNKMES